MSIKVWLEKVQDLTKDLREIQACIRDTNQNRQQGVRFLGRLTESWFWYWQ
jgi:hypothetical protein